MRRREFITLLCGAAIMTPFAAVAQQATKPPTVGFFPGPHADMLARAEAMLNGLHAAGASPQVN